MACNNGGTGERDIRLNPEPGHNAVDLYSCVSCRMENEPLSVSLDCRHVVSGVYLDCHLGVKRIEEQTEGAGKDAGTDGLLGKHHHHVFLVHRQRSGPDEGGGAPRP